MFRSLVFLASLAAVFGEQVVLKADYGNEDMAAQATIVREGFVYPGGEYGGTRYTYSAKAPLYGQLGGGQFSGGDIAPLYPQFISPPQVSEYYSPKLIGGQQESKSVYDEGRRQQNDAQFQNNHGKNGQEFEEAQHGFQKGLNALKNARGDSGSFSGEEGARRLNEDQKQYFGGRQYNKQGQDAAEQRNRQGHRKGHLLRGFQKSHHLDENGRDEQFYDEENNEGGNVEFSGERSDFGANEGGSYRGNHQDGAFNANQGRRQGFFDSEQLLDNSQGNGQHFDAKRYGDAASAFGSKNGFDEQSLLAHQQSNKFFKNQPKSVPFYPSF